MFYSKTVAHRQHDTTALQASRSVVKSEDDQGLTPLHCAAAAECPPPAAAAVVELLIQHRALLNGCSSLSLSLSLSLSFPPSLTNSGQEPTP